MISVALHVDCRVRGRTASWQVKETASSARQRGNSSVSVLRSDSVRLATGHDVCYARRKGILEARISCRFPSVQEQDRNQEESIGNERLNTVRFEGLFELCTDQLRTTRLWSLHSHNAMLTLHAYLVPMRSRQAKSQLQQRLPAIRMFPAARSVAGCAYPVI